jgi:hypothetical protein
VKILATADATASLGYLSHMTLMFWARGLLIWGFVGLAASLGPALLLTALLGLDIGFLGLIAVMLTITVAPIAALSVSAGAILLLVALFRRGRS